MLNDPNEYIETQRMRKWPFYAAIFGGAILLGVLVYSVEFSSQKKQEEKTKPPIAARDDKPLVSDAGGMGMATPPASPAPTTPPKPIVQVVTSNEPPEYKRELEELRRQRHQAAMSALSSPLVIRKVKDEAKTGLLGENNALKPEKEPADHLDRLERLAGAPREGDYNPAADKDKEAFFDRAKKTDKQWISPNTRMAGQRYEVKTGAVIPAVMIGGINSDLPGQIIAQVSQNVFDTANGRFLLVPQGARLYGVYDSRIIYGQSRVLVAWNRIIFPDGSAITLESMPGTDSAGYSGFNDEVNNHYFRTFGGALLMSLITGTTSWAVDSMTPTSNSSNSTNSSSKPTLQQEMASALATQFGQTTSKLLEKNMNIKPTLEIRPGYRFNVIVTKDLVFKEPYREQ
ncbi:TrbI/VirB10 family protein [Desulfovibrio sp. TomC]|uniref:TrbI/VirB10 family protein n=1 Tax=Desulfovibrio sp. TomC TaxID=1562888 RepID=UPI00057538B0|nr:TrbI/VirB10 family protein [Desulfovibrio sp. TomC]KHK00368.1 Conjugative transfer protein TrbI [Desulfovibrio sp. TomC]